MPGPEPDPDPNSISNSRRAAYTECCYFDTKVKDGNAGKGSSREWQKKKKKQEEVEERSLMQFNEIN